MIVPQSYTETVFLSYKIINKKKLNGFANGKGKLSKLSVISKNKEQTYSETFLTN